jgi:hypothetical protein
MSLYIFMGLLASAVPLWLFCLNSSLWLTLSLSAVSAFFALILIYKSLHFAFKVDQFNSKRDRIKVGFFLLSSVFSCLFLSLSWAGIINIAWLPAVAGGLFAFSMMSLALLHVHRLNKNSKNNSIALTSAHRLLLIMSLLFLALIAFFLMVSYPVNGPYSSLP